MIEPDISTTAATARKAEKSRRINVHLCCVLLCKSVRDEGARGACSDGYDHRMGEDASLKRAVWNLQRAGLFWLRRALSEPLAEQCRQPVAVTAAFFFSSRRRHTRCLSDWSSDVCSSD